MQHSIIIITHNRIDLLKRCLASVKREFPSTFEIIVMLNGDDEQSLSWLHQQQAIQFFQINRISPGQARNAALNYAKGEWIGFLDDDIELPKGYFETLSTLLKNTDCQVLGGPDATALDANHWETAIGLALTSPLSTSKTRYRHNKDLPPIQYADDSSLILCNLWLKKSVLGKDPFPSKFWRNEENIMLQNLAVKGIKMFWSPLLYVFHKRKGTLLGLYQAVSSSGEHRLRSFYEQPHSLDWRYFAPAIFVLYLIFLPILLAFSCSWGLPLLCYLILNLISSLVYGKSYWVRVGLIQLVINLSYGLGMWRGLIRPHQ